MQSEPSRPTSFVEQIAKLLYRRHDPKQPARYLRLLVVNVLASLGLAAGVLLLSSKLNDRQSRPVVEVPATTWSILFTEERHSCWSNTDATCPASPVSLALWRSPLKRWSPEYYNRLEADLSAPYWMGVQIPPEALKRAATQGATRLMLGLLFSRYEVWLDGNLVQTGHYLENDLPVAIDIARDRLHEDKPLSIAIAVFRDGRMRTMDSSWFVPALGLFTSKAADEQMRWTVFAGDTRFLIMFAIFMLLGTVFRFAASSDSAKDEFRAAALLSFVLALTQVVMADSVFRMIGATIYYRVLSAFLLGEVTAVLAFGLAVARNRHSYVTFASAATPVFLLLAFFLPSSWIDSGQVAQATVNAMTPIAYIAAGLLCLIQFVQIQTAQSNNTLAASASQSRNTTLLIMTFMLISIGLAFLLESNGLESALAATVETHWARYLVLFPLLTVTVSLAADVQHSFKLLETTPISSFHKLAILPSEIEGRIINIDIKGSETLFRTGANKEVGGTIMSTVLSEVWTTFSASGATVLQSAGDDLLVLYDKQTLAHSPLLWLETLNAVHAQLQVIAQRLADSHVELAGLKTLEYRAAVCDGSVRPLWRIVGTTRVPAWVEAGSKNVFVESARLIELERSQRLTDRGSVVVIEDEIRATLPPHVHSTPLTGTGKHGRQYSATALVLDDSFSLYPGQRPAVRIAK